MRSLSILLVSVFILFSCSNTKEITENNDQLPKPQIIENGLGSNEVKGTVVDKNSGEPIFGFKVLLIQENHIKMGALTDLDGNFLLKNIPDGTYDMEVNGAGYEPQMLRGIKIQSSQTVDFKMVRMESQQIQLLKPILYFYPETTTDISVQLAYKGKLTYTYPIYSSTGWKVKAEPDGTLHDEKGMEYYSLFWEGEPTEPIVPRNGTVVSKDETISFLETTLDELGLNRREANEFILFWLPKLNENPHNLIHFSSSEYEDLAKLTIDPKPETIIRVMMVVQPLHQKIDFPTQDISTLKKSRKGYTVVEWGGSLLPFLEN